MKRFITKTPNGYRVYGSYSCIMDFDFYGEVTYSNVKQGCLEYMAMYRTYVNSSYFDNSYSRIDKMWETKAMEANNV
jgi:hypothetical protein